MKQLEVEIKINPMSFPSQFVSDEEKESREYGLKIGQSICFEWFRKDTNSCRYYSQWRDFHKLRI